MLNGTGATGNTIHGNYIGTDVTGTSALANVGDGIFLGNSANNNNIGGVNAGEGNVISGNTDEGIEASNISGLVVEGNHIGVNAAGTAAIANGDDGISLLFNVDSSTIGSLNFSKSRNLLLC